MAITEGRPLLLGTALNYDKTKHIKQQLSHRCGHQGPPATSMNCPSRELAYCSPLHISPGKL